MFGGRGGLGFLVSFLFCLVSCVQSFFAAQMNGFLCFGSLVSRFQNLWVYWFTGFRVSRMIQTFIPDFEEILISYQRFSAFH